MTVSLVNFNEGVIYLDTMILYVFVRAEPKAKPILQSFFNSIEQGRVAAYTSVLTFDELAYRLLLAAIRDRYAGAALDRLRDEEQKMMAEFYPLVLPPLRLLSQFPNLTLLDVSPDDTNSMFNLMERYALRPRDALHVAAMQKAGCEAIASNDSHFDHVPNLRRFEIVV